MAIILTDSTIILSNICKILRFLSIPKGTAAMIKKINLLKTNIPLGMLEEFNNSLGPEEDRCLIRRNVGNFSINVTIAAWLFEDRFIYLNFYKLFLFSLIYILDDLKGSTELILLNAVYFKGNWKHKFDKEATFPEPFHVDKTTTVDVPTMHINKKLFYRDLKELNAECIALPYENEDLSLVIIIPREIDGLRKIEENLEKFDFKHEDLHRGKRDIELALPRFKVETTIDLNLHLLKMGMVDMFDIKANFSGISDSTIKVDKVIQKAFIEVNEEGSEAAAVTVIMLQDCGFLPPPDQLNVIVDRPFFYKIVYKNNILFSGHIVKPI